MDYRVGQIGRVVVARLDDGEDFWQEIKQLVVAERIRGGWLHILGGIRQAAVVTGPREPVVPPDPVWRHLDGSREVLGFGSIAWEGDEPRIHLHAALGLHGETLTGCVRKDTTVYLVLEVCIVEVVGIDLGRPWQEALQFSRLEFGMKSP
ncbi:MAG: PPC domain-containing DNA-binding protein [Thermodesulfobacteriota bacterium]